MADKVSTTGWRATQKDELCTMNNMNEYKKIMNINTYS